MIRPIDIRLNAAHPELPLAEAATYTGSPSTVLIRGVPPNCGRWAITSVYVAATYPDGTLATRVAVQSANGVWVATIPATATSGRTACGLRVVADGIDENGDAVTGYILGVADFAVCSLAVAPAPEPGGTGYWMRYFDSAPGVVKKGDVTKINGVLEIYNGTAWEPFDARAYAAAEAANANANGIRNTLSTDYYTAAQTDEAIDRVAAYYITYDAAGAAFPTRAALVNAQTYYSGGVARTPTRNDYAVVLADETHDGAEYRYIYAVADGATTGQWEAQYPIETNDYIGLSNKPQINGVTLSGNKTGAELGLASEAEAEALRQGKQSALSAQQLANIAAVSDALAFDATHSYAAGDPVVYNGTLYTFTAAHTGAWTGSDVSAVDIIARLAGKLDSISAAPAWVSGTAYAADALVSYNGVVYRCKADTVSPHTTRPDADTTHWEAKPVSDLFLPLTGGEMTGDIVLKWENSLDRVAEIVWVDTIPSKRLRMNASWESPDNGMSLILQGGTDNNAFATIIPRTQGGNLAFAASNPTAGNLAALDASGNPTDAGWTAGELARYSLVTKTINNGAVSLDDRASNAVTISATLSPNTLTINFPTAPTGKLRDFAMRLNIAAGVTAPEIAWPQGVTLENNGGEVPEIADGGTGGSSTILYFSESENNGTTAKFTVKGETLTAIAQA